jgi:hypothetical protein
MSKVIKSDHAFTEDEIRYLLDRNQTRLVAENAAQFQAEKPQIDPEIVRFIRSLSDEEVAKELATHGLSKDGDLKAQKYRLATWLDENQKG